MSKNPRVDNVINEESVKVFGLATHISLHRMAWVLNRIFDWDFIRIGDIYHHDNYYEIINEGSDVVIDENAELYPILNFNNEISRYEVDLINNKGSVNFFLKELRYFDFLLVFHGEFDYLPDRVAGLIRAVDGVQMATEITVNNISDSYILVSYK